MGPLIAIFGCASDERKDALGLNDPVQARKAAQEVGRELAKAGCRVLVYSSSPDFIEFDVVRGFVASKAGTRGSVQVRYPLKDLQPAFPDQAGNEELFEWRPERGTDWEVAFYRSLEEVQGIVLCGGGNSTLIGGLVAMGHRIPILALAAFGGAAAKVWDSLSFERDLVNREDISLMARPRWTDESASEAVRVLLGQRERLQKGEEMHRIEALRASGAVMQQAVVAMLLFLAALAAVPIAWAETWVGYRGLIWLLFFSPLLGGVSGATIRMVFDTREGTVPHVPQSAWITSALGLVAGGVSGLLFISAQLSAIPGESSEIVAKLQQAQASRLVPFALSIGFIAGLTLDTVFRKLTGIDVVRTEPVNSKKV